MLITMDKWYRWYRCNCSDNWIIIFLWLNLFQAFKTTISNNEGYILIFHLKNIIWNFFLNLKEDLECIIIMVKRQTLNNWILVMIILSIVVLNLSQKVEEWLKFDFILKFSMEWLKFNLILKLSMTV